MGFLRFLIWFLFFYYLIKLLFRILFPWLMKRLFIRMSSKMHEQTFGKYDYSNHQQNKEGEVIVEQKKTDTKSKSDNLGEYIDFEEIKE